MAMRVTGMMSGMDTESIIQQLVEVRQTKVDNKKKEQTKLQWKQDAWKELNDKVKKLYNGTLANLRFESSFQKKTTKVSDSSVAEVITSDNAMNTVQSLRVEQLAKSGYLTGAEINADAEDGKKYTSGTLLTELGIEAGSKIDIKVGNKTTTITVDENMTIGKLTEKLASSGVKVNFDSSTQRFFIGATDSGASSDFSFSASDDAGNHALEKLGLVGPKATKVDGQDAIIWLNNAKFESNQNTFEVNGLTITCNAETGDREIALTTQTDTGGIYDMVKKFINEYSELINQMDKLYNAESAKGYEPLTDEEKDKLSETEAEKYENKIKDAILRKDSTLSNISSAFKQVMAGGVEVDGKMMYLFDFGIETQGYFDAADNEKNAYHIKGDADDEVYASEANTLQAMIASDPDKVMKFFSQLSKNLYVKTSEFMASVKDTKSYGVIYEDLKMKSEYSNYEKKIKEMEQDLQDYEDKWYSKFAKMETAMAKMQSNASAISGLLGN